MRLSFLVGVICCGLAISLHGQSFTVVPNQIEISVAPSFNHTPLAVSVVTNVAGLNLGSLTVSSDSAWVTPTVNVAASMIVLSFTTSNLVNSLYTATITAALAGQTNTFFVKADVSQLNIFKLKDDPLRSRTYGIQMNGLALGSVVVLDPVTTNRIGNVTVGKKPTDLAESADGRELFVINSVDATISVIDLGSLAVKETLVLPAFDNWGQNDTTANVAVGPSNILYYTDGAWAPALRVLDRTSMQVLQTTGIDGNGFGDLALTSDKKLLFGWAQYGWSAGWAGSYIAKFAVATNGILTFLEETGSTWPTTLNRDPLETPVLISSDNQSVFVKQIAVSTAAVATVKYSFPSPVYSISPGGEVAATATSIYQTDTGIKLADLPVNAPVQAISSDYSRFIYFDSASHDLKVLNLLDLIGPGIVNQDTVPANGSITLSPQRLEWGALPGVDQYRVYLGTSASAVAAADTNSPSYLGTTTFPYFQLLAPLTPGTTYYWRVDAVTQYDVTHGDVKSFTVSLIACEPSQIDVATVHGHRDFKTTLTLDTTVTGTTWQATADKTWVSFTQTNGTAPGTLEVVLDASQLTTGVYQANVTLSSGGIPLFSVPVKLRVDTLSLTVMKSDPDSALVYAVSEDASTTPTRAYLLEIDSTTESIRRVAPVGSSVTDLAIHKADNRIYLPNWSSSLLLAIDRTTFQQVRSYACGVYRVSTGGPGRVVWEEEDQWINIHIFDTVAGTNLGSAFVREGGGQYAPDKRYYYHCDNNSSGAAIHKYDTIGDQFSELGSIRVTSVSYYGTRNVVVSEDGSRVFWNGSAFDANLVEQWTIGDEIYATSTDGRYAFANTKIYDTVQKAAVLAMPVATSVSAFNSTSHKLVVQVGSQLAFYQITTPLSLAAPSLSAGAVTYNSIVLNWTDVTLEQTFTLQSRVAGTTAWTDIATLAQNVTQYTATGLSAETTYEFRIKANAATVSSDWSSVLSVTTPAIPATTPSLNAPVATSTSVALSWSNPSYETSIILERGVGSTNSWVVLATFPADTTSYTDTNVVSLTTYYYRVKSHNNAGDSPYSVVRSVTVPTPQPPAAPTGLVAKPLSSSTVLVTWNDVATDETGYRLERRTEDTNSWAVVATLPANTSSYTNSALSQGVQYWFRVQAYNNYGNSPYSNEDDATPANIVNLIADDFDPGLDPSAWASITGGVATNGGQGFLGSKALYFAASGLRSATTIPLDVSQGGTIYFQIRAGNEAVDGNTLWNNSESGETVVLEYTKDNGSTWTIIQTLNTVYPSLSSWTSFSVQIPGDAYGSYTQFRWRQLANSGASFDCWALENMAIQGIAPLPPDAVPFVISSAGSSTSIAVFWIGASRASYYVVQRTTGLQPWTAVATVPSVVSYFIDSGLLPSTAYSYRVQAVNAGGSAPYSPPTTCYTWSQKDQWVYDNYGSPYALGGDAMTTPQADGTVPLLRYAFNLSATEPQRYLQPGQSSGYPRIWLDQSSKRLTAEFVRRKASTNPGITYQVEYSGNPSTWTANATLVSTTSIDSTWELVRYEDTLTVNQANARFCHVKVSQ